MWKQLTFLLVCFALVHALPASSKNKFKKLAHALDDLVREEIEDELGGDQGQSAKRFYLIKAMKHPVSTGDPPLKGHKPQNDQKSGSQPQSTGRPSKPGVTGEPSKDEPFGDSEPPKAKERGVKDDKSGQQGPTRPMKGAGKPPKDDKGVDDLKEGAMKNHFLKRVLVLLSNLR